MKILFATLWLLIPLGLVAYHYGPGQEHLKLDHAEDNLSKARNAISNESWDEAISHYEEALTKLPADQVENQHRIRLEIAKAQMQSSGLPKAREDLAQLVSEINERPESPADLKEEALSTLANSRYYMTYLLKLEGQPASEWEPEIEAARQEYKLLAKTSDTPERHKEDLEAAIRLARADPSELYGLPIPQQWQGAWSSTKPGGRPAQKSKKPEDSRGASKAPPADGAGS